MAFAGDQGLPRVLQVFIHCGDEIFDHLSLKDLHSLGQTCKTIQRAAGEYFQSNYGLAEKFIAMDGIYTIYSDNMGVINQQTQTSGFNQFMNYVSYCSPDRQALAYIEAHSHEFKSINHIYLCGSLIDNDKVQCLRGILDRIEFLQINQCLFGGDSYNNLLKFCGNLKKINLNDDLGTREWLLQHYPHLEDVHLGPRRYHKINELRTFLQNHPNIQSFSTSSKCLWANRHDLLDSHIELDILNIRITTFGDIKECGTLLNELYENGFYKQLHLNMDFLDQQICDVLTSMRRLVKLKIQHLDNIFNLPTLSSLKELEVPSGVNALSIIRLATGLVNLEGLYIRNVTCNDILPFIQHSKKLRKIQAYLRDDILPLRLYNNERATLYGACKMKIFVNDDVFLKTRWSIRNGKTDLDFVEMKRMGSHNYKPLLY